MRRRKERFRGFYLRLLGIFFELCGGCAFGRISLAQLSPRDVDRPSSAMLDQELQSCLPATIAAQIEIIDSRLERVAADLLVTDLTSFGGLSLVHPWCRR